MAFHQQISCAVLFAAFASTVPAQDGRLTVIVGSHVRRSFERDIERVSVSRESVLQADPITTREVLLLGKEAGISTLTVWFVAGGVESFTVDVRPDISLLQEALRDIDPTITAEIAPDRDAIVLRGTANDILVRQAAEAAALNYLDAGSRRVGQQEAEPLVSPDGVKLESPPEPSGQVINLIRLRELPATIESKIQAALRQIAGESIVVTRIERGDFPDDSRDVLVLEGEVPDQVALTRCLHLAATLFLGEDASNQQDEIRVIGNEAGGLQDQIRFGGQQGGPGQGGGVGIQGGVLGQLGFGQQNIARQLGNRIQSNVARATAIEIAKGRIISHLEVDHVPQVRVIVRLYEINRTALFNWDPQQGAVFGNVDQGALLPTNTGRALQGPLNAARVGGSSATEVQNALNFLKETGLTNEFQIAGSNYVYNAIFQTLEADGIAKQLASPTLTVLSGELAQFQAGGEIPIPEAFTPAFGAGTGLGTFQSVAFRAFGVSLGIRPLVGDPVDVTLDVIAQVSVPDEDLNQFVTDATGEAPLTTGFATRSVQTSSKLLDGQALLIGGLMQKSRSVNTSKTPVLGDLPVLGWLFRSEQERDTSTELFVLVSPAVVREPIPDASLWAMPDPNELLLKCLPPPPPDEDASSAEESETAAPPPEQAR